MASSSKQPSHRSVFDAAYIRAEFEAAGVSPHFIPLIWKYVLQNPRCADLDGVPSLPAAAYALLRNKFRPTTSTLSAAAESKDRTTTKLLIRLQHDDRDSAGHGGRRYGRQDYGRHRGQNEHLDDRDKHKSEGHGLQEKVEQARQQSDVDSTWKHDGFFKLEEEAPVAKRRPGFKEMGMPLEEQESAVTVPDGRFRKPDQPGLTSGMGEQRRNYHSREFVRPDDRGTRRGFSDYRSSTGQRNGYDSRGRGFAGRGGRGRDRFDHQYGGRDRFDYQYGGRDNMHEAAGEQTEKWKHDLYDQTDSTPAPMTEEEQIAKVEALLAL